MIAPNPISPRFGKHKVKRRWSSDARHRPKKWRTTPAHTSAQNTVQKSFQFIGQEPSITYAGSLSPAIVRRFINRFQRDPLSCAFIWIAPGVRPSFSPTFALLAWGRLFSRKSL
jgi:hypothetical protein